MAPNKKIMRIQDIILAKDMCRIKDMAGLLIVMFPVNL